MNKKGIDERQILWIFYTIFIIIILVSTLSFIRITTQDVDFLQNYLGKDIGLLVEVVRASPDDILVVYEMPEKTKFDVSFSDNVLLIKQSEASKTVSSEYPLPFEIENQYIKSVNNLVVEKSGDKIIIKNIISIKDFNKFGEGISGGGGAVGQFD